MNEAAVLVVRHIGCIINEGSAVEPGVENKPRDSFAYVTALRMEMFLENEIIIGVGAREFGPHEFPSTKPRAYVNE